MRTLDALVHTSLFSELPIGKATAYGFDSVYSWRDVDDKYELYANGAVLPFYSTDIAAAWVAEAKMGEDGAMMELYTDALIDIVSNETASIYNSAIECDSWGNNDGHTVAYKLAHATAGQRCIAMLRAVGVTQDEIDAAMKEEVNV